MKKLISIILMITITIGFLPRYTYGATMDANIRVYTNKEEIHLGNKNIDYNVEYIYIEHQSLQRVDTNKFDLKNLDRVIKIIVNGVEEEPIDSKGNRKYTVDYNQNQRRIEIKIQGKRSELTHLRPFILRKHSHYNIHIPQGFFKYGNQISSVINHNFVTKDDGENKDILKSSNPSDTKTEINYKEGTITLDFIDNIALIADADTKNKDNFTITSKQMTDPTTPNFNTIKEDIDNYLITVIDNKLIFKKKTGKLNDFAKYTVYIKKDSIYLKNSKNTINSKTIYNDKIEISFETNNWVEWSYPYNNQGTIDVDRVERNPLIKVKFKYNVELADKSKISLSSDGHIYSVDTEKDTWITYDGDILKIDINSLYRGGQAPLRANAAYKLTIGKGALRLKDYNLPGTEDKMENEEINIYFITGEQYTDTDIGLTPEKYTSSPNSLHDDLFQIDTSKLKEDGNIYIHFVNQGIYQRELKWNQWTADTPVKNDQEAVKFFKLYKSPQSYKKSYDKKGIIYDKEFRYDIEGEEVPQGMDEIPIESVEIVKDANGKNTNILKITPKHDLIPYNKYHIRLISKDVLTDNYEKIMNGDEPLVSAQGQTIYTAPMDIEKKPQWEMDKISPEQIIEVEKGPKKTYVIHGVPKYNEYIDQEKGQPIILYADKEVIINSEEDILEKITLYEGYREDDKSEDKRKIKHYKIEYYYDKQDKKKTKISFYPEGELQSGRYYELDIEDDIIIGRDGQSIEGINLRFAIEGDGQTGVNRGIYKFEITNKDKIKSPEIPLLITDFEETKENIEFKITGYNFAEDIKQIRFVRRPDGKTITIPVKTEDVENIKFHDVTLITGRMDDNAKEEFYNISQEGECKKVKTSAGAYDIYIDFARGNTTLTQPIEQRLIIYDRPKVISVSPYEGEQYVDSERLYKEFSESEEGYYIKAVFEDIEGGLRLKTIPTGIQVQVKGDATNLVDSTKPLRLEQDILKGKYKTTEATLYIPLKERLKDGQEYEVTIPEERIIEYTYIDEQEKIHILNTMDETEKEDNRCYKWTFETNFFPTAERLYEGSVPERYDYDYPIVIDGEMFHRNTTVQFRDTEGKLHSPSSISIKDSTIYIYLPRSPRLAVGIYDIIISNGTPYDKPMVYGVFSVVAQGKYIPNEEYKIKNEGSIGTTKEIIGTSKDILELNDRNTNYYYMEIDLDELMGINTWVREISYPISWYDTIETLELKSIWANIIIEDLRLKDDAEERHINLRVGRVEPSIMDILKKKLKGQNIKSNFIEISGTNFDFKNIIIEIPYSEGQGESLKILRYDEETRRFEEITSVIELVNGTVKGMTTYTGIFVILEE